MTQEQKAYLELLRDDPQNDKSDIYVAYVIKYGIEGDDWDEMLRIIYERDKYQF